jgi:hypothetical protein
MAYPLRKTLVKAPLLPVPAGRDNEIKIRLLGLKKFKVSLQRRQRGHPTFDGSCCQRTEMMYVLDHVADACKVSIGLEGRPRHQKETTASAGTS